MSGSEGRRFNHFITGPEPCDSKHLQGTLQPPFPLYCGLGGKLVRRQRQNAVTSRNNKRLGVQRV